MYIMEVFYYLYITPLNNILNWTVKKLYKFKPLPSLGKIIDPLLPTDYMVHSIWLYYFVTYMFLLICNKY